MKILIACEFSGTVRRAFHAKGHQVTSLDLLPTTLECLPGENHIIGDVYNHVTADYDMLIAHPPCQYLSYAGNGSWNNPGRLNHRLEALRLFAFLWQSPIKYICIENPRGCASPTIAKYSQLVHPYYFGSPHSKATCLWLKNLPPLKYNLKNTLFDNSISPGKPIPLSQDNSVLGKKRYFTDAKSRKWQDRSITFPEIAQAMADQWGANTL